MFTLGEIIMLLIGIAILLVWLYFYKAGEQYANLFEVLDEKEYPLKDIYYIGCKALEKAKFEYKNKECRKLRKEVGILYGEKYADYYVRVIYAQKVTIAMTLLTLVVPLYFFSGSITTSIIIVVFAGTAYYYYGTLPNKKMVARSEEMLSDFSNMISKLALMTNAGMILREAWNEVAYTKNTTLYLEMQKTIEEMNNGVAEIDAIYNFGSRCMIPEIKKFASTIVQGLTKGNSELTMVLTEQSKEAWTTKKTMVKRTGELAASKLLLPIVIMFVGILIMIIIPIFANIGV